jgi:hypothetical protein
MVEQHALSWLAMRDLVRAVRQLQQSASIEGTSRPSWSDSWPRAGTGHGDPPAARYRSVAEAITGRSMAEVRRLAQPCPRVEVVAEQVQLVAGAEDGVRRPVLDIAAAFGPQMAASLLGLDPTDVRRLARGAER